ncbi:hypothetical protein [Mycoplasmopsis fermentans]|uniref:hypothetical protein n=1 Tax=Mycoplasmopsis fermentans TaxID=2115 RepID=UPI000F02F592|nr:hypothetical protein [Mycoplasmopsis fermentans]RMX35300.1 hypothetical protein MFI2_0474 [Mycoplasmopsis fermentans MF-I2]RMX35439.1 hypothetical protein MFI1_0490 [Mycoplasmopsis fermentans MF-I1]
MAIKITKKPSEIYVQSLSMEDCFTILSCIDKKIYESVIQKAINNLPSDLSSSERKYYQKLFVYILN